jgi:hypothetical protein
VVPILPVVPATSYGSAQQVRQGGEIVHVTEGTLSLTPTNQDDGLALITGLTRRLQVVQFWFEVFRPKLINTIEKKSWLGLPIKLGLLLKEKTGN